MNFDKNGTPWSDDPDEYDPEVEALKPEFARLMTERLQLDESDMDEEERRAAVERIFKQQLRAAFLTHAIATEADFDRLWPRLRDDALCDHANSVYYQVIDAIAEDIEDRIDGLASE
jgi:hypothetical protein